MPGKGAADHCADGAIGADVFPGVPSHPSSVKSGSMPGISSCFTKVTKKMNALPGIVSINLPLLVSPDLTEEGHTKLRPEIEKW
jgi:hypothetical protein